MFMKIKNSMEITNGTLELLLIVLLTISIISSSSYSQAQTNTTTIANKFATDIKHEDQKTVFNAESKPYGLTYSEWTSKWWQWAYSIPKNTNPAYDDIGKYCAKGQSGPVWFLTSSYNHPVVRYCTVPQGKSILFTILNSECSLAEFPNLRTENQLRQCAKEMQDSVTQLEANVDGINITELEKYRIQSPLFNFTISKDNILGLPPQSTLSASDGYWVFLKPLPIGKHIISFRGELKNISHSVEESKSNDDFSFAGPYGWDNKVIYQITILGNNSTILSLSTQNVTNITNTINK